MPEWDVVFIRFTKPFLPHFNVKLDQKLDENDDENWNANKSDWSWCCSTKSALSSTRFSKYFVRKCNLKTKRKAKHFFGQKMRAAKMKEILGRNWIYMKLIWGQVSAHAFGDYVEDSPLGCPDIPSCTKLLQHGKANWKRLGFPAPALTFTGLECWNTLVAWFEMGRALKSWKLL